MTGRRWIIGVLALLPLLILVLLAGGMLLLRQGGSAPYRVPAAKASPMETQPGQLEQGAYLARIGNCAGCHSERGLPPFSGGRAFRSEFGTLYSSNLTPDPRTGIGDWSLEEFRHAMRHGVSRSGVLYPAFPFANFSLINDADLDALFAYLRSLPPQVREPMPARLQFPASWRTALIGWRMLYYRPLQRVVGSGQSEVWQRGRYLVDGLGHCAMCHSARGPLESLPMEGYLGGGAITGLGWYAPPLDSASLQRYSTDELADYLRFGTSPHGSAYGPMAAVVYNSLRHLTVDDAMAMATFLKTVPPTIPQQRPASEHGVTGVASEEGAQLYQHHCADCHGDEGRGKAGRYPPLRDSVSIRAPDPVNAVRMILYGAMPATTAGNPRPYSMPPFVQRLSSTEVAELTNYIRSRWGERSPQLTA
ncbi:MAG: c-type cytochrome, partial [Dokdonella sp.]